MKMAKNLAFMAAGVGAAMAYQKYKKPMKKQLDKVKKNMQKANNKLEDMM